MYNKKLNNTTIIFRDIMNNIFIHTIYFNSIPVRVFGTSEKPYFCIKDIKNILKFMNTDNILSYHAVKEKYRMTLLDLYIKSSIDIKLIPENQENMLYVNEPGLYSVIFENRVKFLPLFRQWLIYALLHITYSNNIVAKNELELKKEMIELNILALKNKLFNKYRRKHLIIS
jgi:prophage antirepressor-like protein